MTDNEIIKALECCSKAQNCTACKYEPTEYQKGTVGCCDELMENVVGLINRQKAEIERLKAMVEAAENYLQPLPFKTAHDKEIEKARVKAIRKFAEKMKDRSQHCINAVGYTLNVFFMDELDDLVKDMMKSEEWL